MSSWLLYAAKLTASSPPSSLCFHFFFSLLFYFYMTGSIWLGCQVKPYPKSWDYRCTTTQLNFSSRLSSIPSWIGPLCFSIHLCVWAFRSPLPLAIVNSVATNWDMQISEKSAFSSFGYTSRSGARVMWQFYFMVFRSLHTAVITALQFYIPLTIHKHSSFPQSCQCFD